jgi:hypothetical protein
MLIASTLASRCFARTGVALQDLPVREVASGPIDHILCREGNWFVVGTERYEEEDGSETFTAFELVIVK